MKNQKLRTAYCTLTKKKLNKLLWKMKTLLPAKFSLLVQAKA